MGSIKFRRAIINEVMSAHLIQVQYAEPALDDFSWSVEQGSSRKTSHCWYSLNDDKENCEEGSWLIEWPSSVKLAMVVLSRQCASPLRHLSLSDQRPLQQTKTLQDTASTYSVLLLVYSGIVEIARCLLWQKKETCEESAAYVSSRERDDVASREKHDGQRHKRAERKA